MPRSTQQLSHAPAERQAPLVYFPRRPGAEPDPVPYVLTDDDLIRLLQLDETGGERPEFTLAYYRKRGLLRATKIGRVNRYRLPEVIKFMERLDADQR